MREIRWGVVVLAVFLGVGRFASAQSASATPAAASVAAGDSVAAGTAAWENVASWEGVHPVATRNIVYANVPILANPSANSNPGISGGGVPPVANSASAAPGTIDLHLDVLQMPAAKPTPVVIQLHGGGWIRGDRPSSFRTFSALLAAGMSVVTVDYRLAKDAPAPAAIGDVRCAMAWVKANAAKYNFDLSRVVVYGASAGAHLALMAAYAPASFTPLGCTDQPKVAAVLDFYGPTNLAEGLTEHGSSDFTHQWIGLEKPLVSYAAATAAVAGPDAFTSSAQGASTAQGSRWAEPSEAVLARAREVSPTSYIRAGLPPTLIVNGDNDHTVDPTQSAQLKKALDAAGVVNVQDLVAGGGHGNFSKAEADKAMLLSLKFLQANGVLR